MEFIKNFKTKSQIIFIKALEKIEKIKKINENEKNNYYSYVRSLPSLIIFNGLINTLLFYKSKREKVYEDVCSIYESIFQDYEKYKKNNPNKDLIDYISTLDYSMLRLVTNDIFLIALYLKRVAESEL